MKENQKNIFFYFFVFALLPAILFLNHKGFQVSIPSGLGELSGVLSLSLFAGTIVSAWRNRYFDKIFSGIDKMYNLHIFSAQLAFVLALAHPLLLLSKYTITPSEYIDFLLFPNQMKGLLLGFYALILMMFIVILSLYFRPKYHIWKKMHKLAGPAFLLLYLHASFTPVSVMSQINASSIYLHGLSLFAIIAYLFQSLLKTRILAYEFKLKEARILDKDTLELAFERGDFKFKSGQFVFLSLSDKRFKEAHPFSFVSSPDSKELRFAIKKLGDYTSELYKAVEEAKISKDMKAQIEGPYGVFNFKNAKNKKQIWIAGGVGVTPFISMSGELKSNLDFDVVMFDCVHNETEAIYKKILQKNIKNFYLHESDKKDFLDAKEIIKTLGLRRQDYDNISILLCAPPVMIESLKDDFLREGFDKENIIYEKFNY